MRSLLIESWYIPPQFTLTVKYNINNPHLSFIVIYLFGVIISSSISSFIP